MTDSVSELQIARQVLQEVLNAIREERRIKLPPFDASLSAPSLVAPVSAGLEPNPYGGILGEFRYQFEGEDDLLHLMVVRVDSQELTPQEAQAVVSKLLPKLSPALIWLKPGTYSQHFYFGHDDLLAAEQ